MEQALFIFGPIAILILMVVAMYNGIIKNRQAYQRAWSDVVVEERKKMKVIPALEEALKDYKEYEEDLLAKITSLRTDVSRLDQNAIDTDVLKKVQQDSANLLTGFRVAVEAYPDIKTSGLVSNLMTEIAEQQENVAAAIRIFNQNVEALNNSIETFPSSLVNSILNKEQRQKSFEDDSASGSIGFAPGADNE